MRIRRAADRRAVPRKNGGGVTYEVCAAPEAAEFNFDWRLSVAEVYASGPFSRFPQVDRQLAVLKGRMRLAVDRQTPVELRPMSPPLSFDGDGEAFAHVVEPVTDVNLMTHRGLFRGSLDWIEIDHTVTIGEPRAETVILAIDAVQLPRDALDPLDAIWCGPTCATSIQPIGETARLLVATIWRVTGARFSS